MTANDDTHNLARLETIGDSILEAFELQNTVREQSIAHARVLIRQSGLAIRSIHRSEWDEASKRLNEIRSLVDEVKTILVDYPDLYHSGHTQDALKEYAECSLLFAIIRNTNLPTPEALGIPMSTYINGLAEAATELRRRILDVIRQHGFEEDAERMLDAMDAIYTLMNTIDYPDAVTGGLRRRTDVLRGVLERTRGDLTMSLRQQMLEAALGSFSGKFDLPSE
ncbi:MAG TPA: hypothetical protein VJZ27_00160 [Aggregatilineales bacterium]|nr:hypothetical protein [Aggregatilineales bacterium]